MADDNRIMENVDNVREPTKEDTVAETIKSRFPNAHVEIRENKWGRKRVWVIVPREDYKALMKFLLELDPEAHYSIGIEQDYGEEIGYMSHILLHYDNAPAVSLLVDVRVPKDDPVIPDISDIFPIALQYEREAAEMMGIVFEGIPDSRRLFLPDDFPEGIYPLRLDEKGIPEEIVKNAGHPYYLKGGDK
ncbi:membrane bound hydrogenase, NiFe-hydrogenase large subunit 1 [Thermococcus onnurineus NA1]|uniref:Membrane bound hydrogenase, NiFe-hydrogenase large subunit 1 n=1 Tax=Thermococcus onnurineus (strain NA1) TaxID=523850 RepID=B6YU97_THEON|nr:MULTISPECIES: NADH-quinone oxidoreductase subunit C [Thermococcus]ACJ17082.1 membrane bound hydrogenase, NiFe-hydrogenase large subunit 1 [Thermococcus onnurineus NA1]NJE43146.1 hydrogenase [Thermococcus sp. GR6]NJE46192.1 hydrogenase [Thermococcus sp. GR7]NJE79399.1 hydrogenase [Thermococcus sp. GR4]NJF23987.1 hydrogenase [Thermococcus sp. GR5]